MALVEYGAYDVSGPLRIYQNLFNKYLDNLQLEIIDYLNINFNFGRNPLETEYKDFWKSLLETTVLSRIDYTEEFSKIIEYSQEVNNLVGARYMDYVGMVTALDPYMCFAGDVFSRITDTAWAFGDGQIYMYKHGKILPDGTPEVLREGLKTHQELIHSLINEMKLYMMTDNANNSPADTYGMDRSRFNNVDYLTWKREYYFKPKIREINGALIKAKTELQALVNLAYNLKESIVKWFPESFKLVAYTGLAFNLSKKNESLGTKIISYSNMLAGSVPPENVVTTTALIAVNQANYWKAKVLPDFTNRQQCLTEAIINGFAALVYPSRLEDFIDLTWEFMVPKYG